MSSWICLSITDEELSRYWRFTGDTEYGTRPLDSQTVEEIKQCDDPESIRAHNRELNPVAFCDTTEGGMVRHFPELDL